MSNRHVYAEVPPRVEYSLTDLGKSLKPVLDAMCGMGWKATKHKIVKENSYNYRIRGPRDHYEDGGPGWEQCRRKRL